jgi:hypothetical protein
MRVKVTDGKPWPMSLRVWLILLAVIGAVFTLPGALD